MVVLLLVPPIASRAPLMAKAVECVSGVSGRVIHGDGGSCALAGCETAWLMSLSNCTLNTFLDA